MGVLGHLYAGLSMRPAIWSRLMPRAVSLTRRCRHCRYLVSNILMSSDRAKQCNYNKRKARGVGTKALLLELCGQARSVIFAFCSHNLRMRRILEIWMRSRR